MRLVAARLKNHRLALARGRLRATIYAPPRLFFVETRRFRRLSRSWFRTSFAQESFNVVFVPFADGQPTGVYEVLADGFQPQLSLITQRLSDAAVPKKWKTCRYVEETGYVGLSILWLSPTFWATLPDSNRRLS